MGVCTMLFCGSNNFQLNFSQQITKVSLSLVNIRGFWVALLLSLLHTLLSESERRADYHPDWRTFSSSQLQFLLFNTTVLYVTPLTSPAPHCAALPSSSPHSQSFYLIHRWIVFVFLQVIPNETAIFSQICWHTIPTIVLKINI